VYARHRIFRRAFHTHLQRRSGDFIIPDDNKKLKHVLSADYDSRIDILSEGNRFSDRQSRPAGAMPKTLGRSEFEDPTSSKYLGLKALLRGLVRLDG
jgi:hypothetical protein